MNQIEGLNHVAIIPDGNRRWAAMHNLPALEGHREGAERMHQVVDNLMQLGVKYLTVWGFSNDNWKRTDDEVGSLFSLLRLWIERDTPWLNENGVRLKHIGRLHELPQSLQQAINLAVCLTAYNTGMTLNLAFNYTGRAEIVDAVCRLIADGVPCELVDEAMISRYLYTDGVPDVDLVIRTGDELRLSNFMLWQVAYAEYYFSPVFWPDFDKVELEKALASYSRRDRRLGGD
jgi:undecaprenyl diphosphate synthase